MVEISIFHKLNFNVCRMPWPDLEFVAVVLQNSLRMHEFFIDIFSEGFKCHLLLENDSAFTANVVENAWH